MKKMKNWLLATGMAVSTMAFSQATLPSFYDFNNFVSAANLPTGWTTNISGTFSYATGFGPTGTAGRLDLTGEYIQIQTNNPIGTSTFYLKSWPGSGFSTFTGTVSVEESTTGSSWTALATYSTSAQVSTTAYLQYTVTPANNSRYIRFIFTNKQPNYNIGIDDINLTAAPVTAQEIDIKQGTNSILSGGSTAYFNSGVGTPTTVNMSILNAGTVNTLSLTSASLSGPAASDYTVTAPTFPSSVGPSSNVPLTLTFNPTTTGNRDAVLTIINNDSDEGTYVINLRGIGGSYATQPATQPTNLTFSNIKSYRAAASFSAATGSPVGYLVLKKEGSSAITDVPVDGVAYTRGDAVGTCKVIYSSTLTNLGLSNIYAGKTYQLAIFAYNGAGAYINYNTTSPLTGGFNALGSMQPVNEYNGISVTSSTFLADLTAHTYPHTSTFYGNYDETMIKLFASRDTTAGQKVVTCVYSSENYVYTEPFAFGYMSREHSYCHNWMPSNPADSPERPEYNDQHHLFPTNQNSANAPRSNYPEGEVTGTVTSTYLACKAGDDAKGHHVFEPRANHKGDFARAVMYMATTYNGQLKSGVTMDWKLRDPISTSIAYGQDQNILKKWHFQDPPDAWEISRNDFLDSLQGNRNPFIDSVRYACYIDFANMTYIASPTYTTGIGTPCYVVSSVGINESTPANFEYVVAPNPTNGDFNIMIEANVAEKFELDITDIAGRKVHNRYIDITNGFNNVSVTDLHLNAGVYFVNLIYKNEKSTRKLIIQ